MVVIEYITKFDSEISVRKSLRSTTQNWIETNFKKLNDVQTGSIPRIMNKKNLLIMAPTGAGKTLAAFLGIIDKLHLLAEQNKLEEKIYVLYVSPLKALNNDIHKNLEIPLNDITNSSNIKITAAKRTGDTPTSERSKMLRKPPHILITTPESLALMLAAPKFKEKLRDIQWLIIDEIHSIAENKRGTLLSLCIERLEYYLSHKLTRIGISATIEPPKLIAEFLMGKTRRKIEVIDLGRLRQIDLEVISPVSNLVDAPYHLIHSNHLQYLKENIENNTTTLVFTNTRYLSEKLVHDIEKTISKHLVDKIAVHHGSLDREVRLDVENRLKQGKMKAVFTSTSLEMGIDIGSIDLTMQMGSTKSVRSLLQRVGRSGHSQNLISRGKILVFNRDDLIECAALAKLARQGKIDAIRIPENPTDVLIQFLVGMALEKKWDAKEAYSVITKSYPYRTFKFSKFIDILKAATNPTNDDSGWKYSRLWFDEDTQEFGKRRNSRQAYLQNIGTIPSNAMMDVILEGFRTRVGQLSEKFSSKLSSTDVFILGGKTYRFVRSAGRKLIVREAIGQMPTVPSFVGEPVPRSFEICEEVDQLYAMARKILNESDTNELSKAISNEYFLGVRESDNIANYLNEQYSFGKIPSLDNMIVEQYVEPSGYLNLIVLSLYGKEVHAIISQVLAKLISKRVGTNIAVISTDNGFLFRIPPGLDYDVRRIFDELQRIDIDRFVDDTILETELFKLRFRYAASRALLILKSYGKQKVTIDQQQKLSRWLLRSLPNDFPVIKETIREILFDTYDYRFAKQVINNLLNEAITTEFLVPSEIPSPMSHEIILNEHLDIMFIEDKRSLLLNLHKQVLSKLLPGDASNQLLFDKIDVEGYFSQKLAKLDGHQAIISVIEWPKNETDHLDGIVNQLEISKEFIIQTIRASKELVTSNSNKIYSIRMIPYLFAVYGTALEQEFSEDSDLINNLKDQSNAISPDAALEVLIERLLQFSGPMAIDQIGAQLKQSVERIQQVIWKLQRNYKILSGSFTSKTRQYLLREDRDYILKSVSSSSLSDINEDQLRAFRVQKLRLDQRNQSARLTILDYLTENGPVRDPIEFLSRLSNFKWSNLRKHIIDRDVYFGRFLGRRLVYVHKDDLFDFINITRSDYLLDELGLQIYEIITEIPGIKIQQLQKILNLNRGDIQQSINHLEAELYISRTGWEMSLGQGGLSNPGYIPLPIVKQSHSKFKSSIKKVIRKILRWYGFLTIEDILRISRVPYNEIEEVLTNLNDELSIVSIYGFLYYGLKEHLDSINSVDIDHYHQYDNLLLLSPYDPFFYVFGGRSTYNQIPRQAKLTILKGDKPAGFVDITLPDKDILQILNLQVSKKNLEDLKFTNQLAQKLLQLGKIAYQTPVIYVEEIRFRAANHQENRGVVSIFKNFGYKLKVDHLVAGLHSDNPLTKNEIRRIKLINHFEKKSKRYKDIESLFNKFPRIHSNQLLELLEGSTESKKLIVSRLLRKGKMHHQDNFFYPDYIWNMKPQVNHKLNSDFITFLEEPITIRGLAKKVSQSVEDTSQLIREAVNNGSVEIISPYSRVTEYRIITTKKNSAHVRKLLQMIIENYGPISFKKILFQIKHYTDVSRTQILLLLIQLMDKKEIYSIGMVSGTKTDERVLYISKDHFDDFKVKSQSYDFPEWQIIEDVGDLMDLSSTDQLTGVFNRGNLIMTFTHSRFVDQLKIDDIVFMNLKNGDDDLLLGVIKELEDFAFSKGFLGLRIRKVNRTFPKVWTELSSALA